MAAGLDVNLIAPDGSKWVVHSALSGNRTAGITLSEGGVAGLMDVEFETFWIDDTEGSVFGGQRMLPLDMPLGFYLSDELAGTSVGGQIESDFRRCFAPQADKWDPADRLPQIEVVSELSGARRVPVHLKEAPVMKTERDPYSRRYYDIVYSLRGVISGWSGETIVEAFEGSGASGSGFVTVSNPTDLPMRQTWVLTRAKWTIPDVSWQGPKGERVPHGTHAARSLSLPLITEADQGVRITRQRRVLHASTFTGTNFLGRMNGQRLVYDIPPYTPPTQLPISYTNAPAGGARAELHQPRVWSRSVGLELPEVTP